MKDTKNTGTDRARELFLKYAGNRFFMDREGDGNEYDNYHISKETEAMWADEFIKDFLESDIQGREALRTYATAVELVKYGKQEEWQSCLYYPLQTKQLDDVTVLFLLPYSFRMAERAAGKQKLSKETTDAYIHQLDVLILQLQERVENGTLSRSEDYILQEFSDPVYTRGYLAEIKKKWLSL